MKTLNFHTEVLRPKSFRVKMETVLSSFLCTLEHIIFGRFKGRKSCGNYSSDLYGMNRRYLQSKFCHYVLIIGLLFSGILPNLLAIE